MGQIKQQALHDPGVLAPGQLALPYLREVRAAVMSERVEVDAVRLFGALPVRPMTVLVVPWLAVGAAETYAADLLQALLGAGGGPGLVLVTQQTAAQAAAYKGLMRTRAVPNDHTGVLA